MSRWKEAFEKHPIHTTLETLHEWETFYEGDDIAIAEELRRFEKVLLTIESVIQNLDPEFYDASQLNQLNNHLRNGAAINHLSAWKSGQHLSHIEAANDHVTQSFPSLRNLSIQTSEALSHSYVQKVEALAGRLAKTAEQTTKLASEELDQVRETIVALKEKASELEQAQEKLAADYETRTTTWENSFTQAEVERKTSNADLGNELKNTHAELLRKMEIEYGETLRNLNSSHSERTEDFFQDHKGIAEAGLREIDKIHQRVRELHGLVSEDSVSGTYKSTAKEEKETAERWRKIAMTFFVASAVWLLIKFRLTLGTTSVGVNWPELATAASLTAVLLGAGTYASKQSKSHRDNERELMWFSLEIQAFEPFIASLGEDEKKALRAELTAKLFGRNQKSEKPLENLNPKELSELLSTVIAPIKDLLKK